MAKAKTVRESKILGIPEVQCLRKYGLGIDVAKDFHAICLLIPKGDTVIRFEWEIDNTPRALTNAKRRISSILKKHGLDSEHLAYALESTATYHCPLVRTWSGRPSIVNPAMAASFKARKTDRIDAYRLATQHLQGMWPATFVSDDATEVLRTLTRTRKRLRAMVSRLTNGITTRLSQWNVHLLRRTARSKDVRALVEDFATGQARTNDPEFVNAKFVPQPVLQLMVDMYKIMDVILVKVAALEKQIESRIDPEVFANLLSIPGVGPITIATWMAEVAPVDRFPSVSHCIAYCGMDPTPQISGGKVVGTKLRLGNSHIRPAMIQAAQVMLQGKSLLAQSIRAKEVSRKLMACIGARKIVTLLYNFSIRGERYDETKIKWQPPATSELPTHPAPERPVSKRHSSEKMAKGDG